MILIFVALVAASLMFWSLFNYGDKNYSTGGNLAAMVGLFGGIASACALIVYAFVALSWFSAEYKADIINAEYGTNYSQDQVFWASDVIDTIREIQRQRVELNGNLMRESR